LKAYLVVNDVTPPVTHDLLALLERILVIDRAAESLRNDLALLTPYAVEIRYPDDAPDPSTADAKEARAAAQYEP
jgi:HEPN domain-containing protein